MSDNQYVFEIIRDVGYLIQQIKESETVWFNVKNDGNGFFTARSSVGMGCGYSETSRAIEKAYKVTRGRPDPRDIEIKELMAEVERYKPIGWMIIRHLKYDTDIELVYGTLTDDHIMYEGDEAIPIFVNEPHKG